MTLSVPGLTLDDMSTVDLTTRLTDAEIAERVKEVEAYDRFSVFTFTVRTDKRADEILTADKVQVTSKDGSVYVGHVEDWNYHEIFVNLD